MISLYTGAVFFVSRICDDTPTRTDSADLLKLIDQLMELRTEYHAEFVGERRGSQSDTY